MLTPKNIQIIGSEIAIAWQDESEDFISCDILRANSPSAENLGDKDMLGRKCGENNQKNKYHGILAINWKQIGNYGIRIVFSDHHSTGIYSYTLLKKLAKVSPILPYMKT